MSALPATELDAERYWRHAEDMHRRATMAQAKWAGAGRSGESVEAQTYERAAAMYRLLWAGIEAEAWQIMQRDAGMERYRNGG